MRDALRVGLAKRTATSVANRKSTGRSIAVTARWRRFSVDVESAGVYTRRREKALKWGKEGRKA